MGFWHSFAGYGYRWDHLWAHVGISDDPPHWTIHLYEGGRCVAEARGMIGPRGVRVARLDQLAIDWCAHGIAWAYPRAASLGWWRGGHTPARGVRRFDSQSSSIALRFRRERRLVF